MGVALAGAPGVVAVAYVNRSPDPFVNGRGARARQLELASHRSQPGGLNGLGADPQAVEEVDTEAGYGIVGFLLSFLIGAALR